MAVIVLYCIVQITKSLNWASAAAQSFQRQCAVFININISLWVPDINTGELIPPPDIDGSLCPNACSGQGKCALGMYHTLPFICYSVIWISALSEILVPFPSFNKQWEVVQLYYASSVSLMGHFVTVHSCETFSEFKSLCKLCVILWMCMYSAGIICSPGNGIPKISIFFLPSLNTDIHALDITLL